MEPDGSGVVASHISLAGPHPKVSGTAVDMQTSRSRYKESLFKIGAFILFYLKVLKVINLFVNRFRLKRYPEGSLAFPFIKKRQSRNVQILIYHRVNDEYDPFFPAVAIDIFAKQMEFLSSHFNILPLEDTIDMMRRNDIPPNAIVITFDDGYRDNYLNAYPILKKFSIPATIFLTTGMINSRKVLWHDQVFSAFRETREPFLMEYGAHIVKYPLRTLAEKLVAQTQVINFLKSLDEREKSLLIDDLIKKLKVECRKDENNLMLTWDQVKVMYRCGISFGSHTVSHPILSKVPVDKMREEIIGSKITIEEHLGVPIKTFAYPNGSKSDFTNTTKKILKDAGYICALTTIFGDNEHDQDMFELRRGRPWENHLPSFAAKLNWYKFSSAS
jgi:peptidoglycan/xylan/chitin deacetylase (PgdA/CDA1 family)